MSDKLIIIIVNTGLNWLKNIDSSTPGALCRSLVGVDDGRQPTCFPIVRAKHQSLVPLPVSESRTFYSRACLCAVALQASPGPAYPRLKLRKRLYGYVHNMFDIDITHWDRAELAGTSPEDKLQLRAYTYSASTRQQHHHMHRWHKVLGHWVLELWHTLKLISICRLQCICIYYEVICS